MTSAGESVTQVLAEFVARTSSGELPDAVVEKAQMAVRDTLGVALYGSQQPIGDRAWRYVSSVAPGDGAVVFGRGRASPPGAALANGISAHAVDYDDTFESLVLHPSAPVLPAALAATEAAGGTGRDFLRAYVLGVDVAYRVGRATFPAHYDHGFHSTGTIGTFGAAAAAAAALDLSVTEVRRAFGVAGSSSSALLENAGTMTKPLHAGHAAAVGVRAGFLARDGFTANTTILDGPRGYGEVMTPGEAYDSDAVITGLGTDWGVTDVGFKPYPCGRIMHGSMNALRRIVVENDLHPVDVAWVEVTLDPAAEKILVYEEPANEFEAKGSIEFCHATILREHDAGVREFTDATVTAERTRDVMTKITRNFERGIFDGDYGDYGARVRVRTTDGEEFVATERYAPGSPNNPLSRDRLQNKFEECASAVLDAESTARLEQTTRALTEANALDQLGAIVLQDTHELDP